jgi:nitrous oxidase accessory protein
MALSPKLAVNKKAVLVLLIISLLAPCILNVQSGKAGPKKITVPDDYPTITDAISNANDGDTIFVKKGNYEGPINQTLVIDKAISLVGEDVNSTKISLHPRWIESPLPFTPPYYDNPIKIEANDVKISGFTIASDGGDISAVGDRIQIIGNIIKTGLKTESGSYQTIAENTLTQGIDLSSSYSYLTSNKVIESNYHGIEVGGFSNLVYGNNVTGVSAVPGISLHGNGSIIAKNTVTNCQSGLVCVINSAGSNNVVYSNKIINNVYGLQVDGGNNNTFTANDLINNSIGARIGNSEILGKTTILYHNNFVDNIQQVSKSTNSFAGYLDNGKEGNYWSDYTGTDTNGDGVGDTPYIIDAKRQDRYPLMAPFDIDSVTVELPEWASPSTSPSPSPTPTDNKPLPTTLLVAVAIIACVFGFGLIINLLTAKRKKTAARAAKESSRARLV